MSRPLFPPPVFNHFDFFLRNVHENGSRRRPIKVFLHPFMTELHIVWKNANVISISRKSYVCSLF